MSVIIPLTEIRRALEGIDVLQAMEQGFVVYSAGRVVVPPVGELLFDDPPGDVHIKYGYIPGDEYFVIKVASGFYDNPKRGLPANSGLMLLFSQKTGELAAILLDEGHLTNVRTAAAGAVVAKHLAARPVSRIGILGAGVQARMQLEFLQRVTDCRDVLVWGRRADAVATYRTDMEVHGFRVEIAAAPGHVARACDLVVTATASHAPLLTAADLHPGLHVTAMGSDTADKNELAPDVLGRADLVVADSLVQCIERGEIHHAVRAGVLESQTVVELGGVLADPTRGRSSDHQITIADLTGVAVQDIQIATAVYRRVRGGVDAD